jgi:O-antigen/teichoic acid export membrane protein
MGIIRRQGIKNTIVYYTGLFIGSVNLLLLFPYFMNSTQFGLTRILIAAGLILTKFSQLGVPNTVVKYFPYFKNEEKGHHGILFFALISCLIGFTILSGISLIFKEQLLHLYKDRSPLFVDYYYYAYVIGGFMVLFNVTYAYARALWKSVLPTLFREVILRAYVSLLLIGYFFELFTFPTFLLLFICGYTLPFVINILYLLKIKKLFILPDAQFFKPQLLKDMISYSFYVFLSGATILFVNKIDNMMIGWLGPEGLADLAVYSVAFFIGTVIVLPGRGLRQIAAPIVADAWEENNIQKVSKVYKKTSLNQFLLGSFILILIWLNIDSLLSFLPENYSKGKYVILFIGLSRLFRMGMGVNKQVLRVSQHFRYEFWSNLLLIILVLVSNYLLIPVYGINGAAIATLLSFMVRNLFVFIIVWLKLNLQPFTLKTLKALLVACLAYLGGLIIPSMPVFFDIFVRSVFIATIFGIGVLKWGFAPDINEIVALGWEKCKNYLRKQH